MKERKDNNLAKLVGSNIAARRKQKNWTQAQLGEKLGIGTDSLCRIERGVMAPRFQRLNDIAHFLDCSVADLFKTPEELFAPAQSINVSDSQAIPLDIPSQIAKLSEQIILLSKIL